MKKSIFVFAMALCISLSTNAQNAQISSHEKKDDLKELRKNLRDLEKDKFLVRKEFKEGDISEVKDLRKDINADRKEIKRDVRDLKAEGVKHPIKKVERQVHHSYMKRKNF